MTRPLRSSSDVAGGFTRLERTILSALAAELRDTVHDLARQFAASRPGRRLNTGFGLFTTVDFQTPAPLAGPTGDFGSVHAMVGALPDPIAFTVRLQDGRLVGLMGESYGQDTRQIDFATAPFDQVFTIDASGRSIPVQSAPMTTLHATPPPFRSPSPPLRRPDVSGARQIARPTPPAIAPGPTPSPDAAPIDRLSLLIGVWTIIGVIAVLAVLLLDVPWPFALVAAVWVSAMLRKPKAVTALQRGLNDYQKARAAQQG